MNKPLLTITTLVVTSLFLNITLFAKEPSEKKHKKAYDKTRDTLLEDVEKAWTQPTLETNIIASASNKSSETECNTIDNSEMIAKLNSLIISNINLEDASLNEAIDYLKQKSRELDPNEKGINIILKLPPSNETSSLSETAPFSQSSLVPHISLQLHQVPFYAALDYVARQANMTIHIDPYAVSLLPSAELDNFLITKEYQVPSNFIPTFSSAKEYLQLQGVEFPLGASANYLSPSSKLILRTTQKNIDIVDTLVAAMKRTVPYQISIETKFIEVTQDHLDQLGFNWLLGPFQIGSLSGSGGGTTNGLNANAYPFSITGMNPIGSLQSGNDIISDNSIDSVISNGSQEINTSHSVPGIFSFAGIYSNPQFQLILRALNQKKGIDLMAAPHVTTKDGVKATVKIIDEFIYPTQYAPPQIPQSTTNSGSSAINTPPTITPAFPNTWITKNLGVILEAKPTIASDGYSINLELHPQLTDFDGFINYGTPINTIGYTSSGINMVPFSSTLTTNTINQPVFTVREVTTSVTVCDGQTVVLGGLIREDIQKSEDKVPFLGDIPLAGRLFRSKAEKKIKKNLIIFVTPRILNTDGAPLHKLTHA